MKKAVLIAMALFGAGIATSKADVGFSISIGHGHHDSHHARAPRSYAPVYSTPVVIEQPRVIYSNPRYIYQPSHGDFHHQLRDEQRDFQHAQRDTHQEYHHEEFDRNNYDY